VHPSSFSAGNAYSNCRKGAQDMCIIPFRLVADSYLYAAFGPTYMLRIPIFNGANVGKESTVHVPQAILVSSLTGSSYPPPSTTATNRSKRISVSEANPSSVSHGLGHNVGANSNVVPSHIQAFQEIATTLKDVKKYTGLPPFIANCTTLG